MTQTTFSAIMFLGLIMVCLISANFCIAEDHPVAAIQNLAESHQVKDSHQAPETHQATESVRFGTPSGGLGGGLGGGLANGLGGGLGNRLGHGIGGGSTIGLGHGIGEGPTIGLGHGIGGGPTIGLEGGLGGGFTGGGIGDVLSKFLQNAHSRLHPNSAGVDQTSLGSSGIATGHESSLRGAGGGGHSVTSQGEAGQSQLQPLFGQSKFLTTLTGLAQNPQIKALLHRGSRHAGHAPGTEH